MYINSVMGTEGGILLEDSHGISVKGLAQRQLLLLKPECCLELRYFINL